MKISYHITFFYLEDRLVYLRQILNNIQLIPHHIQVFIHTNVDIDLGYVLQKRNIVTYYHDLKNTNPFYLSWKHRDVMREQVDEFDVFIYSEDDILITYDAIAYWLNFKDKTEKYGYSLGFLRTEIKDGKDYIVDLPNRKFFRLKKFDNFKYILNDINPYCAFWIMDQSKFRWFLKNEKYDQNAIVGYGIREKSAIGINGLNDKLVRGVLIPFNKSLPNSCKVYHLPNNYINHKLFSTIAFDDAVDFSLKNQLNGFLNNIKNFTIRKVKSILNKL